MKKRQSKKNWRKYFKLSGKKESALSGKDFKRIVKIKQEVFNIWILAWIDTVLSPSSFVAQYPKKNRIKFSQQPCWMGAKFKFYYNCRILTWLGGSQVQPIGLFAIRNVMSISKKCENNVPKIVHGLACRHLRGKWLASVFAERRMTARTTVKTRKSVRCARTLLTAISVPPPRPLKQRAAWATGTACPAPIPVARACAGHAAPPPAICTGRARLCRSRRAIACVDYNAPKHLWYVNRCWA